MATRRINMLAGLLLTAGTLVLAQSSSSISGTLYKTLGAPTEDSGIDLNRLDRIPDPFHQSFVWCPQMTAVEQLLARSRLLGDVRVQVPLGVYREYLARLDQPLQPPPMPYIAQSGSYTLQLDEKRKVTLSAEVGILVLNPSGCVSIAVLDAHRDWQDVQVNGKPVSLPLVKGQLELPVTAAGLYVVTAKAPAGEMGAGGGGVELIVPATVQTMAALQSPGAWQLGVGDSGDPVNGTVAGTKVELHVPPTTNLRLAVAPADLATQHEPRYEVSGDIAWDFDGALQQVTANLRVMIAGGASDKFELLLPEGATGVTVKGPRVRDVQVAGAKATVYLIGQLLGATIVNLQFARPLGSGLRGLGKFGIAGGHWTGGTLVVTNSAGGGEVVADLATGLKEIDLADIPRSASAILPGPAAVAYQVTGRDWSASLEVLDLGEFAMRESIADLAHYELYVGADGSTICRASYEIRNRNRQFLALDLPKDARILLARVNERSRPISPAEKTDRWLIALERSQPSVKGLVSFPVEIIYTCRQAALAPAGSVDLPLPAIDLPVAYAWCELYLPAEFKARKWSGLLRPVEQLSSKTAKASLDYGFGISDKPPAPVKPATAPPSIIGYGNMLGAAGAKPAATSQPAVGYGNVFGKTGTADTLVALPDDIGTWSQLPPATQGSTPTGGRITDDSTNFADYPADRGPEDAKALLARNNYRVGRDYYDRGDYAKAQFYFSKVAELAPESVEADNSKKLMANTTALQGKLAPQGTAEKAAVAALQKDVTEQNRYAYQQRESLVEQAGQEQQAGNYQNAKVLLQAAQNIQGELDDASRSFGADHKTISALNSRLESVQAKLQEQAKQLKSQYADAKGKRDYAAALEVGRQLRQLLPQDQSNLKPEDRDFLTDLDKVAVQAAMANSPQDGGWGAGRSINGLDPWTGARVQGDNSGQVPAERPTTRPTAPAMGSSLPGGYAVRPDTAEAHAQHARELLSGANSAVTFQQAEESARAALDLIETNKGLLSGKDYQDKVAEVNDLLKFIGKQRDGWSMSTARAQTAEVERSNKMLIERQSGETQANASTSGRVNINSSSAAVNSLLPGVHQAQPVAVYKIDEWINRPAASGSEQPNAAISSDEASRRAAEAIDLLKAKTPGLAENATISFDARSNSLVIVGASDEQRKKIDALISLLGKYYAPLADEVDRVTPEQGNKDRREKIAALIERAKTLMKQGSLKEAIEILDQIMVIEPENQYARNTVEALRQKVALKADGEAYKEWDRQMNEKAVENRVEDIPWNALVTHPDNWNDLTKRRKDLTMSAAAAFEPEQSARRRMGAVIPQLNFTGLDLDSVLKFFHDWANVDIRPNWPALEKAGITKDTPVSLHLNNATVEKALATMLDDLAPMAPDAKLGYAFTDGIVTVSAIADLNKTTIIRTFDVRDLIYRTPNFVGPRIDLSGNNNASNESAFAANAGVNVASEENSATRRELVEKLMKTISSNVAPSAWKTIGEEPSGPGDTNAIREMNGTLVVTARPEEQQQIADLIERLREVRGPQVEQGGQIAQQQTLGTSSNMVVNGNGFTGDNSYSGNTTIYNGTLQLGGQQLNSNGTAGQGAPSISQSAKINSLITNGGKVRDEAAQSGLIKPKINITDGQERNTFADSDKLPFVDGTLDIIPESDANAGITLDDLKDDPELRKFITGNYDWALTKTGAGKMTSTGGAAKRYAPNGSGDEGSVTQGQLLATLLTRLANNQGQKVAVTSTNIAVPSAAARAFGVQFRKDSSGLTWATVDEAQFRSLLELGDRGANRAINGAGRTQDTIVGADALLANGETVNIAFAADRGNRLAVGGELIDLPHDSYLLVDNGGTLTAILAGSMQYWTEKAQQTAVVMTPQNLEIPRHGQLVLMEKALLDVGADVTIHVEYEAKK